MPRSLRQTEPSNKDIAAIWEYTSRTYGVEQADAYIDVLSQAFRDIQEYPERPSSQGRPDLGDCVRSFHIKNSTRRSSSEIKAPRHIVFYSLKYDDEIVVLRVLHERMDIERHIADET